MKQLIFSLKSLCLVDPVLYHLFFHCIDSINQIITRIVNISHSSGVFPKYFKSAFVKPFLTKSNGNLNDLTNYRLKLNLSFLSELAERVIAHFFSPDLSYHGLMSELQLTHRTFHFLGTALCYVKNDVLASLDAGYSTVLLLLDLSAAFKTINHSILTHRLRNWFGISSTALDLFPRSYQIDFKLLLFL